MRNEHLLLLRYDDTSCFGVVDPLVQFTWIGLVIQILFSKRPPRLYELAAVAIILFGTVFASGCYKTGIAGYSLVGFACACLAASAAHCSSRCPARCEYPALQRSVVSL